jgi:hypothetical protein
VAVAIIAAAAAAADAIAPVADGTATVPPLGAAYGVPSAAEGDKHSYGLRCGLRLQKQNPNTRPIGCVIGCTIGRRE